ncbi:uncharacterized protein LOC119608750 [Lucilia sericata]|uniref:uncharacterized protein LOC119608750 n=1 Tax=Lucilia sericata TaxID=13632 RepID=UPI0018A83BD3|nr:uncharacterized protein LOC119608750 [Lucilia sericata]
MDRLRLIAEIRKRPVLWKYQRNFARNSRKNSWKEVVSILGIDYILTTFSSENLQSIWRYMRECYRNEVKRTEILIEKDILNGLYDVNKDYTSKWAYFNELTFLNYAEAQPKTNKANASDSDQEEISMDNENNNTDSEITVTNEPVEDSDKEEPLKSPKRNMTSQGLADSIDVVQDIKIEAETTDDEDDSEIPTKRLRLSNENSEETKNNDEEAVDIAMSENENNVTHLSKILEDHNDSDQYFLISFSEHLKTMSPLQNLQFRAKMSNLILSILTNSLSDNKLVTQGNKDQLKTLVDVAHLDSNFLISFWPYMKLMTQEQNLKFRCQITDLILNILSTPPCSN